MTALHLVERPCVRLASSERADDGAERCERSIVPLLHRMQGRERRPLAGTTGSLRSTTGGATWEPLESSGTIGSLYLVDPFLPRPSIFADPGRPGVIYLADAGLNC